MNSLFDTKALKEDVNFKKFYEILDVVVNKQVLPKKKLRIPPTMSKTFKKHKRAR